MYTHMYIYFYVCIYMHIYKNVYILKLWLCIYVCICLYIYIYISRFFGPFPLTTVIINIHFSIPPTAWSLDCLRHTRQCVPSDETCPVITRLCPCPLSWPDEMPSHPFQPVRLVQHTAAHCSTLQHTATHDASMTLEYARYT